MTAPGPQQPDEVERYTPEPFTPAWADEHVLGLIDRNRRALALVRASTGELATRVELILSGADRPAAPSAQPDDRCACRDTFLHHNDRAHGGCIECRCPEFTPAQPVRDTEEESR